MELPKSKRLSLSGACSYIAEKIGKSPLHVTVRNGLHRALCEGAFPAEAEFHPVNKASNWPTGGSKQTIPSEVWEQYNLEAFAQFLQGHPIPANVNDNPHNRPFYTNPTIATADLDAWLEAAQKHEGEKSQLIKEKAEGKKYQVPDEIFEFKIMGMGSDGALAPWYARLSNDDETIRLPRVKALIGSSSDAELNYFLRWQITRLATLESNDLYTIQTGALIQPYRCFYSLKEVTAKRSALKKLCSYQDIMNQWYGRDTEAGLQSILIASVRDFSCRAIKEDGEYETLVRSGEEFAPIAAEKLQHCYFPTHEIDSVTEEYFGKIAPTKDGSKLTKESTKQPYKDLSEKTHRPDSEESKTSLPWKNTGFARKIFLKGEFEKEYALAKADKAKGVFMHGGPAREAGRRVHRKYEKELLIAPPSCKKITNGEGVRSAIRK